MLSAFEEIGSLVLLFAITGCVSIFRPTPVLEEDKSEILKADKQFILLNENLTPVVNPDFTSLDKN